MRKKKSRKADPHQTPPPAVATVKKKVRDRETREDEKIDEELEETFPASDAPSTTPTAGPGSPKS